MLLDLYYQAKCVCLMCCCGRITSALFPSLHIKPFFSHPDRQKFQCLLLLRAHLLPLFILFALRQSSRRVTLPVRELDLQCFEIYAFEHAHVEACHAWEEVGIYGENKS